MAIQPPPPHELSPHHDNVEGDPLPTNSARSPSHALADNTSSNTTETIHTTIPSAGETRAPTSDPVRSRPRNPYHFPDLSDGPLAHRTGSPQVVELDDGVRSLAGSVGWAGESERGSEGEPSVASGEGGRSGSVDGGDEGVGSGANVGGSGLAGDDDLEKAGSDKAEENITHVEAEQTLGSDPFGEGNINVAGNSGGSGEDNASNTHSDPFPYSPSKSPANLPPTAQYGSTSPPTVEMTEPPAGEGNISVAGSPGGSGEDNASNTHSDPFPYSPSISPKSPTNLPPIALPQDGSTSPPTEALPVSCYTVD